MNWFTGILWDRLCDKTRGTKVPQDTSPDEGLDSLLHKDYVLNVSFPLTSNVDRKDLGNDTLSETDSVYRNKIIITI